MIERAKALQTQLEQIKNKLHGMPELSFLEHKTTEFLKREISRMGLEIIDIGMETGVVALLRGARPGKTVALRTDIDAIERPGENGSAAPQDRGAIHGCGHDFHMTCLLGAAALLTERKHELFGNVAFLFQPAEEITRGAQAMIDHGLFEKLPPVDSLFGLHNRPEIQAGKVGVKPGALMAGKSNFEIVLHGVAGHGGMPHKCVDVIVAAAAIINAVQTVVSRNTDPLEPIVCAICSIHAGTPKNLITDTLTMTGSLRSLSTATHQMAQRRLDEIVRQTAAAYGCTAELTMIPEVPVLENGEEMTALARRAAAKALGEENIVVPEPCLASEDFAVFGQRVPAFFYWLGSGVPGKENAPWHSGRFATDDRALHLGALLLAESALVALEKK
ncbi:MAG: M20 family metallopeptidase [Bacillota bacterium]